MTFATTGMGDGRDKISDIGPQGPQKDKDLAKASKKQGKLETLTFDRKSVVAIYDEYQPLIYGYIYRRTGEVEIARDLTTEVFHRFLKALYEGNEPTVSLRAWLYRVAHNLVIDYYRRREHRQHLVLDEKLYASGDGLDQAVERTLLSERLRLAIAELTEDQQQVITLKFLEGLSNEEVAGMLGKTIGAVKSLQHRALASLQRQLTPAEEEAVL